MDFSLEHHAYNSLLNKVGITGYARKTQLKRVLIPLVVCWLPIAVYTLIAGDFWTGTASTSFITDFDLQAKAFVSMPIFILAESLISQRIKSILNQFINSGIVGKEEYEKFHAVVKRRSRFLESVWTDVVISIVCYAQSIGVLIYEGQYTNMLTWQVSGAANGIPVLNFAGYWVWLVLVPFLLFLFYRWLVRIIVWGLLLKDIAKLKLTLYAVHPDLVGGLGFLGYSIGYFSPIAFAISAAVAGKMANFVQMEGAQIADLRIPAVGYLIFITILFIWPLLTFSWKLFDARERSVFENYDFANAIFRELRKTFSKGYDQVTKEDLNSIEYSAAADLSSVIKNALDMKFFVFTLKDMIPLWVISAAPFLLVVIMKIPLSVLLLELFNLFA